jgi:glycine dehydrogenase
MLRTLTPAASSVDEFVSQVIPADILSSRALTTSGTEESMAGGLTEANLTNSFNNATKAGPPKNTLTGGGYYDTIVPPVIARNILENPAWYTSYTPYQAEISQGRLESLLNFQTLVTDLTGLPMANASLLDEGTAAAEAMTLSMNALSSPRAKNPNKTYVVSHTVHPQTISVLRSRSEGFGITIKIMNVSAPEAASEIEALGESLIGVLVQYPDTKGGVDDFKWLSEVTHEQGALLSAATDLMALTVLTPPGEWGADIAFGSTQRLGVPMGFGGPHAAFFAVKEAHKRRMPGRLVGVSKDRLGGRALRLSLQTREQHIRREKATSNVCTAQALLANMSAFYAIFHGPHGLKTIAEGLVRAARVIQGIAERYGYSTQQNPLDPNGRVLFDTVTVNCANGKAAEDLVLASQRIACMNFRRISETEVGISVGESMIDLTDPSPFLLVAEAFKTTSCSSTISDIDGVVLSAIDSVAGKDIAEALPAPLKRQSSYLSHPVFNSHRSETEILRYIYHLQSKDLSLVHSMIPLGSCTMKLNATTEMMTLSGSEFSAMHPFAPASQSQNIRAVITELEEQLKSITAMDGVSLQPNSGAQGEFAGLRVIRKYHEKRPGAKRDICLIPVSAHGTNPASAAMAGMRVVPIKCDTKTGNLDMADLEAKCNKHADELGAIMVTYPSTFGVFEPNIKRACELVHQHGGQVYMDGANMNAQIGLCSPGEIGADVCHLNLHKTFCIPHGGGGPGVGPICVKEHLAPYLPGVHPGDSQPMVASAPFGSASILPISWSYIKLMGKQPVPLD